MKNRRQLQILYIGALIDCLRMMYSTEMANHIERCIEQVEDDFDLFRLRGWPDDKAPQGRARRRIYEN